ncbi:uncharacterized protein BDV14DRAFT_148092 [Aspergillus stella-maris]|uniref:uncharacterized protein n=1 Tax=Aspergillus stella-maris TaxID=1810926 RepID=UPI003CCD5FB4
MTAAQCVLKCIRHVRESRRPMTMWTLTKQRLPYALRFAKQKSNGRALSPEIKKTMVTIFRNIFEERIDEARDIAVYSKKSKDGEGGEGNGGWPRVGESENSTQTEKPTNSRVRHARVSFVNHPNNRQMR